MKILEAGRHRRHLRHLAEAARELDENIRLEILELNKNPRETEKARVALALARCGSTVTVDRIERAIGELPDGKLRVVA